MLNKQPVVISHILPNIINAETLGAVVLVMIERLVLAAVDGGDRVTILIVLSLLWNWITVDIIFLFSNISFICTIHTSFIEMVSV